MALKNYSQNTKGGITFQNIDDTHNMNNLIFQQIFSLVTILWTCYDAKSFLIDLWGPETSIYCDKQNTLCLEVIWNSHNPK